MVYNTTNLTNANNYFDIVKSISQSNGGGYIGIVILLMVFFILFISLKRHSDDTKSTFLTCSILTTIVGFLLLTINLISLSILIYPMLMTFAGFLLVILSE